MIMYKDKHKINRSIHILYSKKQLNERIMGNIVGVNLTNEQKGQGFELE